MQNSAMGNHSAYPNLTRDNALLLLEMATSLQKTKLAKVAGGYFGG